MGLKPVKISNITLTSSLQAVEVDEDILFSKILFGTQNGEDYEIALENSPTAPTFKHSYDRSSSPVVYDFSRKFTTDSTTIFYVKGSGTFQIQFLVD